MSTKHTKRQICGVCISCARRFLLHGVYLQLLLTNYNSSYILPVDEQFLTKVAISPRDTGHFLHQFPLNVPTFAPVIPGSPAWGSRRHTHIRTLSHLSVRDFFDWCFSTQAYLEFFRVHFYGEKGHCI